MDWKQQQFMIVLNFSISRGHVNCGGESFRLRLFAPRLFAHRFFVQRLFVQRFFIITHN